ncbi:alpha-ketoglutarate-dependent dioxygenase alkB homolog 6-like [Hydra vulgaris]|uniref:Alpha-ketoglutarate-dependent dioxygenase alkB homolog 6-like n=1 Tax=Hydra vulgaris TaxID=6087 RepID=A0ABM4CG09_HYDVU
MQGEECFKLEKYRVFKAPSSAFYIPNFLTLEDEDTLLSKIYEVPKPKWTILSNRRLQNWGGLPHAKGMVPEAIPSWLNNYITRVGSLDLFDGKQPNHVLINEYQPSQGIMPHFDGPLFYPTISTITVGSHTLLDFYKPLDETDDGVIGYQNLYIGSFLLERRSLVCFKESMYSSYMHGIKEVFEDNLIDSNVLNDVAETSQTLVRGTRLSITIRHFPKVLKFKMKLGH